MELLGTPDLRRLCLIHVHRKLINCISWHPQYTGDATEPSIAQHWLATGSNESVIHIVDVSTVLSKSISVRCRFSWENGRAPNRLSFRESADAFGCLLAVKKSTRWRRCYSNYIVHINPPGGATYSDSNVKCLDASQVRFTMFSGTFEQAVESRKMLYNLEPVLDKTKSLSPRKCKPRTKIKLMYLMNGCYTTSSVA